MDIQGTIDEYLMCKIVGYDGKRHRVLVQTKLDGHTLLELERHIRQATGLKDLELLCESKPDDNQLRILKAMRGVQSSD